MEKFKSIARIGRATRETDMGTNEYNAVGQLIHQTGSTYPVAYEYDSQGRKIKMTTYADSNDPAVTQWLYDEPTGLLTNKLYDDGNGPTYTYYPDGKLHTRTWARGITATYTYNIFGEQETTTYSDDTPSISNTYNRLGQKTQVIQSTTADQRITTYEYSSNTFALLSESINGTNVLSYSYDSRGRRTGETCLALNSSYTFDEFGRQSSLTSIFGSETNTFHFNYLQGSAMIASPTGFYVLCYYIPSGLKPRATQISPLWGFYPQ